MAARVTLRVGCRGRVGRGGGKSGRKEDWSAGRRKRRVGGEVRQRQCVASLILKLGVVSRNTWSPGVCSGLCFLRHFLLSLAKLLPRRFRKQAEENNVLRGISEAVWEERNSSLLHQNENQYEAWGPPGFSPEY